MTHGIHIQSLSRYLSILLRNYYMLGLLHCIESSQYVSILIYRRLRGDFTFKDCMCVERRESGQKQIYDRASVQIIIAFGVWSSTIVLATIDDYGLGFVG